MINSFIKRYNNNNMKKIVFGIIGIVLVALIGAVSVRYFQIKNFDPPSQSIFFDEYEINYEEAKVSYDLIGQYLRKDIHYSVDSQLPTINLATVEHSLFVPENAIVTVTSTSSLSDSVLIEDQHVKFKDNGIYTFVVEILNENIFTKYVFSVSVELKPIIHLPELSSTQGSILYFQIDNVPMNSKISVESDFSESTILQKDNTIIFYIPMWYAAEVKEYPLNIYLNDDVYEYLIDLNEYEFRELHFTVPTTTVSSTVGNPNAAPEYREIIYPTYESAVDNVYWNGNFILPVEGARISSNFGDKRFVNNATTPTRHVGIDYAIDCGTDVLASNGGKVIVAYNLIMIGNTVVIDHGLGLKTYYEHMQDLNVKVGDIVEKGDIIGHVGTTGYSTGCHLHFQSMVMNQSFNPESLYTWLD